MCLIWESALIGEVKPDFHSVWYPVMEVFRTFTLAEIYSEL